MLLFKKGSVNTPEPKSNEGVVDFGEEQGNITGLNCKKLTDIILHPVLRQRGKNRISYPK